MARIPRIVGHMVLAAALGAGGVYALNSPDVGKALAGAGSAVGGAVVSLVGNSDCRIKGNVSIGSGERIYHVPGQRYYTETTIRPEYGERWFCSEADARAAGWRKSGV